MVALAAGAAASTATAQTTTRPYLDAAYESNLDDLIRGRDGSYYGRAAELSIAEGSGSTSIRTGLWRARTAAGTLPALRSLNTIALGATAFGIGWKIGRTIDTKWLHLSGDLGTATFTTNFTGASWTCVNQTGCGTNSSVGAGWTISFAGVRSGTGVTTGTIWRGCPTSGGTSPCTDEELGVPGNAQAEAAGNSLPGSWVNVATFGGKTKSVRFVSAAALEALVSVDAYRDWDSATDTPDRTSTVSDPAPLTSPQRAAARAVLDAEPAAADWTDEQLAPTPPPDPTVPDCDGMTYADCVDALQAAGFLGSITSSTLGLDGADIGRPASRVVFTNPQAGTTAAPGVGIVVYVNPAVLPISLPSPLDGETGTDYRARLLELGFTDVTLVTVTADFTDPAFGPSEVISVTPSAGGSHHWPDDPIRVRENPADAPAGTDEGSDCICPTNSLDLSPLTGIDYGSKFPFGLFTYAAAVVGFFDVEPVAPSFHFNFSHIGSHELGAGGDYDVSLDDFSPYMATIRTILSVALWVGAIWYLAARLLHFDAAGDPGEAVDEGMAL